MKQIYSCWDEEGGKGEEWERDGQQPVLELRPVSVSFHGMNARVSDVLGTTRRRRRPASHKYGIRVFGALSIKRNPDSCCCFYDSYCIHRFWLLPRRHVIGNVFATKTGSDSRKSKREQLNFYVVKVGIFVRLTFPEYSVTSNAKILITIETLDQRVLHENIWEIHRKHRTDETGYTYNLIWNK